MLLGFRFYIAQNKPMGPDWNKLYCGPKWASECINQAQ